MNTKTDIVVKASALPSFGKKDGSSSLAGHRVSDTNSIFGHHSKPLYDSVKNDFYSMGGVKAHKESLLMGGTGLKTVPNYLLPSSARVMNLNRPFAAMKLEG